MKLKMNFPELKFPPEIWENILDFCDDQTLINFQNVCLEWKEIVQEYVMSGRLKIRSKICQRLEFKSCDLVHKRNIHNVVSFSVSTPILLTGVGIYGGQDDELLDESLTITFDRSTTSISVWDGDVELGSIRKIVNTEEARAEVRASMTADRISHTRTFWFPRPLHLVPDKIYDIDHNVLPTDVKNHFSGWPITLLGSELWTCWGSMGDSPTVTVDGVQFTFAESQRHGRSSFQEGQIPFLAFWKLAE